MTSTARTPNRLAGESSPYLRQHASNPVDWYPWGEEVLARARRERRPIFLSIGYSACHWCHVMERESFVDPEIAELLNRHFLAVKVDREERPDLDQVYQTAVQALSGQGGWPLSAFLTPDGAPFFGGTYYPPAPAYGRPSFRQLLTAIARAWQDQSGDLEETARRLAGALAEAERPDSQGPAEAPGRTELVGTLRRLTARIDGEHGGFGGAPKFPEASALILMLRFGRLFGVEEAEERALFSLRRMAHGGIHDQLGGGFHRYATDERWLVPHFEKMLYDQAQLLTCYCLAFSLTGDSAFSAPARGILGYLRREMTAPEGVFYATQDADSEGVEGKYFLWSSGEVEALLSPGQFEAARLCYGLTETGNFEGVNILHQASSIEETAAGLGRTPEEVRTDLEAARAALLEARERRSKPFRDEKIITAWNGLMISGLAQAWQALGDGEALAMASRAAGRLLRASRDGETRLLRTEPEGPAKIPAFLDDYAFLIAALIDLYESDFDPRWLEAALPLLRTAQAEFRTESGQYRLNGESAETLFAPAVSGFDQAIPSGAAVQILNLLRLGTLTGEEELAGEARRSLAAYGAEMVNHPAGHGALHTALATSLSPPVTIVTVWTGMPDQELLARIRRFSIPYRILAGLEYDGPVARCNPAAGLFRGRQPLGGRTTAYVCADLACQPPAANREELEAALAMAVKQARG